MTSDRLGGALGHIHRLFGDGALTGLPDAQLLRRYVSRRDELAFEALVKRHGPMVMAVCRSILSDPNDADDAFQAAFLLLGRKAGSLWVNDSLGGWLHRVACRIALQVKSDAARRRDRERRAAELSGTWSLPSAPRDDRHAILHEEIDRLPERYRQPIVLCYLEEMTYQQAASHLRWSEGATQGRLKRARDLLKTRLVRRGVSLAGAAVADLAISTTTSAVSAAMLQATVRAARHVVLGEAAAVATVSAATSTLVNQALRSMMITKLKMAGAAALVVGAVTCAATVLAAMGPAGVNERLSSIENPKSKIQNRKSKVPASEREALTLRGVVLRPDGRPAAGATLYTVEPDRRVPSEAVLRAKADADGAFRFTVPKAEFDGVIGTSPWASLIVLATADGLGPDWVALRTLPDEGLSFHLVEDTVPISGRVLDLQGKPVVGAKVTRGSIRADVGTIDPYLTLLHDDPMTASNHRFAKDFGPTPFPGQPASVATDAEGRFKMTGIGRDRIVEINIEAPTIQSTTITAVTRATASVTTPRGTKTILAKTIYGASFDHLVPPGRAITGVVRDKVTQQPLAGVTVCGKKTNARATTDAQGRFTLPGFPKGNRYELMVLAGEKVPYFDTCLIVPDTAGLAPIDVNVECVPGIPMRLKLIDRETGQPVTGADVAYWLIYPNPHSREVPGFAPVRSIGAYNTGIWQSDGTYLLGVLPGPGGVFVRTPEGVYRPACVDPMTFFKDNKMQDPKQRQQGLEGDRHIIFTAHGDGVVATGQSQFSAIVLINPAEGSAPLSAVAVLERDQKREVRVAGPDGELLTGVTVDGEGAETTKTPRLFTVSKLNPLRPTRFTFRQQPRNLVGCLVAGGDEIEGYTVRLQPPATITGRVVDAEGKPRQGVDLTNTNWYAAVIDRVLGIIPEGTKTDTDGRFRIEGLVPNLKYEASATAGSAGTGQLFRDVTVAPGEVKDLGDLKVIPPSQPGG